MLKVHNQVRDEFKWQLLCQNVQKNFYHIYLGLHILMTGLLKVCKCGMEIIFSLQTLQHIVMNHAKSFSEIGESKGNIVLFSLFFSQRNLVAKIMSCVLGSEWNPC